MLDVEEDAIDRMYRTYAELTKDVSDDGEWSFSTMLNADVRKLLVLACASRFEKQIQEIILRFAESASNLDERLVNLVKSRVIERQYHQYFDWTGSSANKFFSMFGPTFKDHARARVEGDENLKRAIGAFIEIGRTRNELVHGDFVTFPLEKTADEVFALFQQAMPFIIFVREQLNDARCGDVKDEGTAESNGKEKVSE